MTFVDSNVFIYAVGRPHPLRDEAQVFFRVAAEQHAQLVTSAEVLQELLHVYLPVRRFATLDAALRLATDGVQQVFQVGADAVHHARTLIDVHPGLTARDLIHLSVCRLHDVSAIKSFDRGLEAAFAKG